MQRNEHNAHPAYRPDIDGLRAIAILSVVIFHAFPLWLPGGFVGVDIFFVISGFLISTIIFRSMQEGHFSFTEFYAHRIRRIFPALIFVLSTCYVFGWHALLPDEFKQLGKHMAAGAGFVQNFILRKELGYFDTAAEFKPLLHLWSLAIEEQFYLIYPILIFAVWRSGRNTLSVIVLLGLVSFGLNIAGVEKNPAKTFFLPQTRCWELLAGSVLAYLKFFGAIHFPAWMPRRIFDSTSFHQATRTARQTSVLSNFFSIAGLFLIIGAVTLTDKSKPFPGWLALLPVSGATLLILSGPEASVNRHLLASKAMVFVGLISYPLYLWHWPILSFMRIIEGGIASWEMRAMAVILSFISAWLTYRLIERPIRFGGHSGIKSTALILALALAGYVGFNTYQRNGLEFRAKEFLKITEAAGEWDYPGKLVAVNRDGAFDYYLLKSERQTITLFVGDSNIEQYLPRVEALIASAPKDTNGVIFKTGGGCLPIPDQPHDIEHRHCSVLMQNALRIAEERPEIDSVVIGSLWNQYLQDGAAMIQKFGVGSAEYADALSKLGQYIEVLHTLNKHVFLVLNIPAGKQLDPKYMVKRDLKSFPEVLSIRTGVIPRNELEAAYGQVQADLKQVAIAAGATVINPMDALCSPDCSGVDADGVPMYKDAGHLRPKYVRERADFIDATVR